MRAPPILVLLLLLGAAEAQLIQDRPEALFRPDLLLIACTYFSLWFGTRQAIWFAVVAGILRDLHSIDPFGLSAVAFASVSVVIGSLREEVYREHPITHAILGGIAAWIPVMFSMIPVALGAGLPAAPALLSAAAIPVLHTTIFAPLLILPLQAAGALWGVPASCGRFTDRI